MVSLSDVRALLGAGGLSAIPASLIPLVDAAPHPSADLRGFGDGKLDYLDGARTLRYIEGLDDGSP